MMHEKIEYGTCPVCQGTGRIVAGDYEYKRVISSYDEATDTLACSNCGGYYMYGRLTTQVRLDKEGKPCVHNYNSRTIGRCLTEYLCENCNDRYEIDSGD